MWTEKKIIFHPNKLITGYASSNNNASETKNSMDVTQINKVQFLKHIVATLGGYNNFVHAVTSDKCIQFWTLFNI